MTGFTPDVSQAPWSAPGYCKASASALSSWPLGTVAFGTLPPALRTQRTGLFNLMRNIGASIGISMMGYLLVRNSAVTQAGLVEHVTPFRQVIRDHAQQLGLGHPRRARRACPACDRAGGTVAFIDNFKLMMFVSLHGDSPGDAGTTVAPTARQGRSGGNSCRSLRSRGAPRL